MFAMVGRWVAADITFSVENDSESGGVQAHIYERLTYDERREVEEGLFFFRPDGDGFQLQVPDKQLDTLFDAGFTRRSEKAAMSRRERAVENSLDVLFYKYTVTDQQFIVDMMNALLRDSLLEFP